MRRIAKQRRRTRLARLREGIPPHCQELRQPTPASASASRTPRQDRQQGHLSTASRAPATPEIRPEGSARPRSVLPQSGNAASHQHADYGRAKDAKICRARQGHHHGRQTAEQRRHQRTDLTGGQSAAAPPFTAGYNAAGRSTRNSAAHNGIGQPEHHQRADDGRRCWEPHPSREPTPRSPTTVVAGQIKGKGIYTIK